MSRRIRALSVVAVLGLLVGAMVGSGPAEAAKRCKKFKPAEPASDSQNTAEAKKAKVVKVTDKRTEKKPLVFEYSHGPAAWWLVDPEDGEGQRAIVEDTKWFNIQVDSKKKFVGLYVRQEWSPTPVSDMDLYIYDKTGSQAGSSGEFNQVPGTGLGSGDGGNGYEQVLGMGTTDCSGYTLESRAFTTPGESMKLKVWLGSIR